jgi:uncharacterized membrane protein YgaE (UPF0421/DUF939 family)
LTATAIGATIGAVLAVIFGQKLWIIGLSVLCTILFCWRAGFRDAAKLAAYISALVLLEHAEAPVPYATSRFLETGIGIAAAFVIIVTWSVAATLLTRIKVQGGLE